MKSTIAQYIRSEEKIDERACEIFEIYSKHFLQGDEYVKRVHVDEDPIRIEWEVSWRYGGHDEGSIYVPKEVFCGEWRKWVVGEIEKSANEKTEKEKKAKASKVAKEKRQLKKLQEKYGSRARQ